MSEHLHDMDALLVKYITGEATAEERNEVQRWLAMGEGNQTYYNQFITIWKEAGQEVPVTDEFTDMAWRQFGEKYIHRIPAKTKKVKPLRDLLKVAAALLIAIAGSWLAYTLFSQRNLPVAEQQEIVTAGQEIKTDTLPDRSVVTLNQLASIQFAREMKGAERKVELKGEAFFDVTPDMARPFLIEADGVEIRVLGTSFNVKSSQELTEVIVATGLVEVSRNGETTKLSPGEKLVLKRGQPTERSKEAGQLYRYYASKTFICDNTPLWKLVEKLNEVYGVNIVIERKELAAIPITVSFNDESLDTILDIIAHTLLLKVDKKGNDIFLQ